MASDYFLSIHVYKYFRPWNGTEYTDPGTALSTDEFNWNEKHKKCYFSYEKRKSLLEAIRYVDLVIPEENWEQKVSDIKEYHVDTFVMGDDWEGKFDFLKPYCDVVYLPRTPEISTTQIKPDLQKKEALEII